MPRGAVTDSQPAFGDLLRIFRTSAGLTQEALAERASVSPEEVGALERGIRRAPYRATLSRLALALGLPGESADLFFAAAMRGRLRLASVEPSLRRANNLPYVSTPLIGRAAEIEQLIEAKASHRLVTIVGAGGVGKTRVALEAARQLFQTEHDEAWFVDLSTLHDGQHLAGKIVSVMVPPPGDYGGTLDGLIAAIAGRKMLLILDNCEHLIDDVAIAVRTILTECPLIDILATSRERLGINAEKVYRLAPFVLPPKSASVESLRTCSAVELFVRSANCAPGFVLDDERIMLAAEICRTLDGIPLAIELAAGRVFTLGLETVHQRIGDEFVLKTSARDVNPRQRTMLATITWSYDLLNDLERMLFRRLGVFSDGNTLQAAEAVCADDVLGASDIPDAMTSLVEKSLVLVEQSGDGPRFRMLYPVRRFAATLLKDAGESEALSYKHALWLASLGDETGSKSFRMPPFKAVSAIGRELANLDAALDWSLSGPNPREALLGARIVSGLRSVWIASGLRVDLRRWVELALEYVDENVSPLIASRLLWAHFWSLSGRARLSVAQRVIALLERLEDSKNIVIVRMHLAYGLFRAGRVVEAQACAAEGLVLIEEERWLRSDGYAFYLTVRALFAAAQGEFGKARATLDEADRLASSLGDEYIFMVWSPPIRVEVEFVAGNLADAGALAEKTLVAAPHAAADRLVFEALSALSAIALISGEMVGAAAWTNELLRRARGRDTEKMLSAITYAATVAILRGGPSTAARLLGFVDRWREAHGYDGNSYENHVYELLRSAVRGELTVALISRLSIQGANLTLELATNEALEVAAAG